jgi:hypothetical protein
VGMKVSFNDIYINKETPVGSAAIATTQVMEYVKAQKVRGNWGSIADTNPEKQPPR